MFKLLLLSPLVLLRIVVKGEVCTFGSIDCIIVEKRIEYQRRDWPVSSMESSSWRSCISIRYLLALYLYSVFLICYVLGIFLTVFSKREIYHSKSIQDVAWSELSGGSGPVPRRLGIVTTILRWFYVPTGFGSRFLTLGPSLELIIKARKVNTDIIRMGKKPLQLDLTSDGWHFKGTLNRMTVGSEKVGGIMTAEKAGITGQEQDFGSGRVFVVTKTQEGLRDTDKGIFANFRIGDKDSAAPAEGTVQLQNGVKEVLIKALVKTIDDQYKVATAAESVGDI